MKMLQAFGEKSIVMKQDKIRFDSIPLADSTGWIYDVDASPKVGATVPSTPDEPDTPDTPSLPQTGQLNWPVPVLACSGILLFAAGWCLNRKGKKEQ